MGIYRGELRHLAASPDGKSIAVGSDSSTIVRMPAAGGFYLRAEGRTSFLHFDGTWRGREVPEGVIQLRDLKEAVRTVCGNAASPPSLWIG